MDSNGVVAIVALIISLVALLATTGQVLQQYFATADGYRRCQTSVMGVWGNKTRLKWRWREFRFETIYYVPSISISISGERLMKEFEKKLPTEAPTALGRRQRRSVPDLDKTHVVSGRSLAENWWNSPERRGQSEGGEMVCWVTLLERLRLVQGQMNSIYNPPAVLASLFDPAGANSIIYQKPTLQCIRIHERSWDFMVICQHIVLTSKSLLTCNSLPILYGLCAYLLSLILQLWRELAPIYILHDNNGESSVRLGMEWKEFDPAQGNLRAEGHGNLITSRMVRSVGTVLEYRVTDSLSQTARRVFDLMRSLYLPVLGISDLLFGIVPGNVHLECFDRSIGKIENINKYLESIDDGYDDESSLPNALENEMRLGKHRGWLPGFNDIISLTAPRMVCEVSLLNNIPMPNTYHPGLLSTHEGLKVFCQRLRLHVIGNRRDSPQLEEVLSWVHTLQTKWEVYWQSRDSEWATAHRSDGATTTTYPAVKEYRATILKYFDLAEDYLRRINTSKEEKPASLPYSKLVDQHIKMAVRTFSLSEQQGVRIDTFGNRNWLGRRMDVYWDHLPKVAERVAMCTDWDEDQAAVAWVTMIFRAFCWHHLHRLVPTKYVLPVEWHESKLPVYIG